MFLHDAWHRPEFLNRHLKGTMLLGEEIKAGLDTVTAAGVLAWSFLGSLADIAVDLISGRDLPQPDLKSVAAAPEPGAISKVRPPIAIPRPTRKIRHDEAA